MWSVPVFALPQCKRWGYHSCTGNVLIVIYSTCVHRSGRKQGLPTGGLIKRAEMKKIRSLHSRISSHGSIRFFHMCYLQNEERQEDDN